MKGKKITKILSTVLAVMSLSFANPCTANAEWIRDAHGWWNSKGSSWSVGWEKIDEKWYYFNTDGYMVTGWQKIDGQWYYFTGDGAMKTGIVKDLVNGAFCDYYCGDSGAMVTGWIEYNGEWHYYNEDGTPRTGWLLYNSKWYYIKDGVMLRNNCVGKYELGNDGVWIDYSALDKEVESEEGTKAKELIYKNDKDFVDKLKNENFELGKAKETTIKDFVGSSYNIPDEKCYKINVYEKSDSAREDSFNYLVGSESGKVYSLSNQGGYDTYEIKDNKIVNTFYYENNIDESTEWRYADNDENSYTKRSLVKYEGNYLDNSKDSIKDIKDKSSFTMDDALQLAVKNDSKALYSYKNLGGLKINIKKGEEVKCSGTVDGKWNIPEGKYYSFEVSSESTATMEVVDYSYMVNKDTKDVYLVPKDETLPAYKMDNNKKAETYKCITNDTNHEWRK